MDLVLKLTKKSFQNIDEGQILKRNIPKLLLVFKCFTQTYIDTKHRDICTFVYIYAAVIVNCISQEAECE